MHETVPSPHENLLAERRRYEAGLRRFFRFLSITALFVLIGLCLFCRERLSDIVGFSRPAAIASPSERTPETPGSNQGENKTESSVPENGYAGNAEPMRRKTPLERRNDMMEALKKTPEKSSGEPSAVLLEEPSAGPREMELRFLGVVARGTDFVFVVDACAAMGGGADSPFALARKEVLRSCAELHPGNRFQIVVSNDAVISAPLSLGRSRLAPATRDNRRAGSDFLKESMVKGQADLAEALLEALRMQPDTVLVVSDTYSPPLSQEELSVLRRIAAGRIAIHTVEIGDGIEPTSQTPLGQLAAQNYGQYYYVSGAVHRIAHPVAAPPKKAAFTPADESDSTTVQAVSAAAPSPEPPLSAPPSSLSSENASPKSGAEPTAVVKTAQTKPNAPKPNDLPPNDLKPGNLKPGNLKPPGEKTKKYNLSKGDQAEIEEIVRIVYRNASETELLAPGILVKPPEKIVDAFPVILNGAKAGFPPAEYLVGLFYINGIRTPIDEAKGFDCFLRASQDDFSPALTMLAECYRLGRGIDVSSKDAIASCERAIEKNDPVAMFLMGMYFADTDTLTFEWLFKAAAKGSSEAMYQLGKKYETGKGIMQNPKEANSWYRRAAEAGNEKARTALKKR